MRPDERFLAYVATVGWQRPGLAASLFRTEQLTAFEWLRYRDWISLTMMEV